jgi:hypothetical protein
LEIFWPDGETLKFPEAKFSESMVMPLRVGRPTPRAPADDLTSPVGWQLLYCDELQGLAHTMPTIPSTYQFTLEAVPSKG